MTAVSAAEPEETEAKDADEEGNDEEGAAAAEAQEGKDEGPTEPIVRPGLAKDRDLVLCLDTIGKNTKFAQKTVEFVQQIRSALIAALERTENAMYEQSFKARAEAMEPNKAAIAEGAAAAESLEAGQLCALTAHCVLTNRNQTSNQLQTQL